MQPFLHIGDTAIPSYGMMIVLAILLCGPLGCWRAYRKGLRWEDALAIMAMAFVFAITGAAVLYMLVTYTWEELLTILLTFRLPEGGGTGLVFLGGLLAAIPGALLGCRIVRCRLTDVLPPLLPVIPLGHALGRMGCFLAGCCYGRPTTLPIGVVYHESLTGVPTGIPLLPVQLMEAALLLGIFALLMLLADRHCPAFRLTGVYAIVYGICRFGLEFLRYDSIRGSYAGLSTSQWISLLLMAAGVILMLPQLNRTDS